MKNFLRILSTWLLLSNIAVSQTIGPDLIIKSVEVLPFDADVSISYAATITEGTPGPEGATGAKGYRDQQADLGVSFTAYGIVKSSAAIFNGSQNFTCTWNATQNRYEIEISGENYYYPNYVTTVTPLGYPAMASTASGGGKLLVSIYDTAGNPRQGLFSFQTIKI